MTSLYPQPLRQPHTFSKHPPSTSYTTRAETKILSNRADADKLKGGVYDWMDKMERDAVKIVESAVADLDKVRKENDSIRRKMGDKAYRKRDDIVKLEIALSTIGTQAPEGVRVGTPDISNGLSVAAQDEIVNKVVAGVTRSVESQVQELLGQVKNDWMMEMKQATSQISNVVTEVAALKSQLVKDALVIHQLKTICQDQATSMSEMMKMMSNLTQSSAREPRPTFDIRKPMTRRDSEATLMDEPQEATAPRTPTLPHSDNDVDPPSSPETLVYELSTPTNRSRPPNITISTNLGETSAAPPPIRSSTRPPPTRPIPPPPRPVTPTPPSPTITIPALSVPIIQVTPPTPPLVPPPSSRPTKNSYKTIFIKYEEMMANLRSKPVESISLKDFPWPMLPTQSQSYPQELEFRTEITKDRVQAFVTAYCSGKGEGEKMVREWKTVSSRSKDQTLNGTAARALTYISQAVSKL